MAHDPVGRGIEAAADVEPLDDDRAVESPRIDRGWDDPRGSDMWRWRWATRRRHRPPTARDSVSGRRPDRNTRPQVADVTQVEERRCDTRPSSSTGNQPLDDWPRSLLPRVVLDIARDPLRVGCNSSDTAIQKKRRLVIFDGCARLRSTLVKRHRVRILSAAARRQTISRGRRCPECDSMPRRRPVPMTRDSTLPRRQRRSSNACKTTSRSRPNTRPAAASWSARKLTLVFRTASGCAQSGRRLNSGRRRVEPTRRAGKWEAWAVRAVSGSADYPVPPVVARGISLDTSIAASSQPPPAEPRRDEASSADWPSGSNMSQPERAFDPERYSRDARYAFHFA